MVCRTDKEFVHIEGNPQPKPHPSTVDVHGELDESLNERAMQLLTTWKYRRYNAHGTYSHKNQRHPW